MVTRSEPAYLWDFCGGHLAIDFTNTVGSRGGTPDEHFNVYEDVLSWAETRGVIARDVAQRLRHQAARRPAGAQTALTSLVAAREALYRVLEAASSGRKAAAADLLALNAHVGAVFSGARLRSGRGRLELTFEPASGAPLVEAILTPVMRAAVELLTNDAISRVRPCADASCAWLFMDTTRNRTRRWCDMKICGNRHKVRRFRDQL